MKRRILVATYGSTGDLAPLLPIAREVERAGAECLLAVPRFLGLHLRRLGIAHVTYGAGTHHATTHDDEMLTTRFAGWESWRRLMRDHTIETLAADVDEAGDLIDGWQPDVVVTSTFAVAVRIAAHMRGTRHIGLAMYPDLLALEAGAGRGFCRDATRAIAALAPDADRLALARLAWGFTGGGAVLHDPAVVPPALVPDHATLSGFPYFDAFPALQSAADEVEEWLERRRRPVALVTFGSFVRRPETIRATVDAARQAGLDALVLNSGRPEQHAHTLAVGFLPLSTVAPRCAVAVHHGGIGTFYGAIHSGIPSVVVPRAFDQPRNAALAERHGVGRAATAETLAHAITAVATDSEMTARTASLRDRLVTPEAAAATAAGLILSAP